MSLRDTLKDDPQDAVYTILGDVRAGMLGVEGSGQHMQPMTHFPDPDSGEVWFVTSLDSDLVRAVGLGAQAQYCLITPDQDGHACLRGPISQVESREKLDEIWSPALSAWFEGGKDDPDICLLRLTLNEAAVWASTSSAVVFAFEIARANLEADHRPAVGEHRIVHFGKAA